MSQKQLTDAEQAASMFLTSVEEAVKIGVHANCFHLLHAHNIATEFMKKHNPNVAGIAFGICFYAGIVEGIRRERARKRAREESAKLRCPQVGVTLSSTEGEADTYHKLIIRLINGIESEKALRAILFVVQRCLKNKVGERQQTPVERLRNRIMHQLTWIKSEEGLDRISRYIDRHWPEDEAS